MVLVALMVVGDFHCPHEMVQVTADHPQFSPGVWVHGDPENQTAGVWVIVVLVQNLDQKFESNPVTQH